MGYNDAELQTNKAISNLIKFSESYEIIFSFRVMDFSDSEDGNDSGYSDTLFEFDNLVIGAEGVANDGYIENNYDNSFLTPFYLGDLKCQLVDFDLSRELVEPRAFEPS